MDILDIDEILKDDSFCNLSADQKMDESITSILQQWKQNEVALGPKGTKLVDTRTFTRPKKRGMGESDHESGLPASGINLQVGGLVTSLRRSLIGETSPPSSFCSSVDSMNEEMLNSLINSGDFNNVSFFMENMEESPNINFNGYNLDDVIRDRQFIDNLTSSEDQTFSKDASISRMDDHMVSADSSDSNPLIDVTMKLNPNFEGTFITKDTTFNISNQVLDMEPRGSETFNLMGDTSIENVVGDVNETFKCDAPKGNTTFGVSDDKNASVEGNNLTYIEGKHMNQTFIEPTQEPPPKRDQPEKIDNKTPPDSSESIFQSTPLKSSKTKENQKKINLSPIKCININSSFNLSKEGNFEKYLQEATDQIFTPDKLLEKPQFERTLESPEDDEEVLERRRLPIPINMLREEERQSLRNFEEYEKTLMQENDKEFDDVLSRFATLELRQSNEKMRQSLDSIKKRHSLVNLEKQQQEDENRGHVDSNKLSESIGKSRRLLRRSRIYDEVNNSLNQSPEREKVQETEPPSQTEPERVVPHHPSKGNRDRFKTIRIFRPPDQNSPHLPDAGDTTIDVNPEIPNVVPEPPKVIEMEKKVIPMEPSQGFKKPSVPVRNIPKPKYFKSALAKPMSQQKFNSADDLLDSEEPEARPAAQSLKSPMGIKSKSIHNLLSGQKSMASMEKLNSNQCDFKSSADGINKTHPNSKLSLLAPSSKFGKSNQSLARVSSKQQQQPASDIERHKIDLRTQVGNNQSNIGSAIMRNNPKRLGLVRPSSGYYSYSVRRNDSDTESGRYSPQSLSSSSASSKGSLNVPEVSQNPDTNTFDSHQSYNSLQPDAMKRPNSVTSKVPRPTGLRLPSNFRTAGGASAVPRPSGIPRR